MISVLFVVTVVACASCSIDPICPCIVHQSISILVVLDWRRLLLWVTIMMVQVMIMMHFVVVIVVIVVIVVVVLC